MTFWYFSSTNIIVCFLFEIYNSDNNFWFYTGTNFIVKFFRLTSPLAWGETGNGVPNLTFYLLCFRYFLFVILFHVAAHSVSDLIVSFQFSMTKNMERVKKAQLFHWLSRLLIYFFSVSTYFHLSTLEILSSNICKLNLIILACLQQHLSHYRSLHFCDFLCLWCRHWFFYHVFQRRERLDALILTPSISNGSIYLVHHETR